MSGRNMDMRHGSSGCSGCGHSGKGRFNSSGHGRKGGMNSTIINTQDMKKEMKFILCAKGAECKSYATVKDHIANYMQSNYENIGEGVAETIWTLRLEDSQAVEETI